MRHKAELGRAVRRRLRASPASKNDSDTIWHMLHIRREPLGRSLPRRVIRAAHGRLRMVSPGERLIAQARAHVLPEM